MKNATRGFTLIELIVSMMIASVLLTFMAMFVTGPVDTYLAQTRRAALVDSSDSGWQQIDADIRSALPNSLRRSRNGSIEALELLQTIDVGRYRDAAGAGFPTDLDFATPDGAFTTAGRFATLNFNSATAFLVVNSTAAVNAYSSANVITPAGTQIQFAPSASIAGEVDVTLTPNVTLDPPGGGSPQHRIFLVSGPVSYLCNEAAGTLTRYSGYGINAVQPNTPAALAGATATLLASNVTACNFAVNPGTASHGEVATLRFTFSRAGDPLAEQMTVMRQTFVEYVP